MNLSRHFGLQNQYSWPSWVALPPRALPGVTDMPQTGSLTFATSGGAASGAPCGSRGWFPWSMVVVDLAPCGTRVTARVGAYHIARGMRSWSGLAGDGERGGCGDGEAGGCDGEAHRGAAAPPSEVGAARRRERSLLEEGRRRRTHRRGRRAVDRRIGLAQVLARDGHA